MGIKRCPDCGAEMRAMPAVPVHYCDNCRCAVDRKGRLFRGIAIAVLADYYVRKGEEEKAENLAFGRLEAHQ